LDALVVRVRLGCHILDFLLLLYIVPLGCLTCQDDINGLLDIDIVKVELRELRLAVFWVLLLLKLFSSRGVTLKLLRGRGTDASQMPLLLWGGFLIRIILVLWICFHEFFT
jgi:hypothetical protein